MSMDTHDLKDTIRELEKQNEALLKACCEALVNLDRLNDSGFGPVTDMASNKTYQMLSDAINQASK